MKTQKAIIAIILNLMFINLIYSAEKKHTGTKHGEKGKSTINKLRVKAPDKKKQESNSGQTQKQRVLNKIKSTNNELNKALKKTINSKIRSLIADARRFIRLAAMHYRKDRFDNADKLCSKADEKLKEINKIHEKYYKIIFSYRKKLKQAQRKHSVLHRQSLQGDAGSQVYKAGKLIDYSQRFAGKEIYNKADKYIERALTLLEKAESKNSEQKNEQKNQRKLAVKANGLSNKAKSLLWKMKSVIVPGPIRRDYYKAHGHYLRGNHFSNTHKYAKSIEEFETAIKLLAAIPEKLQSQGKLKAKASAALRKAKRKYDLAQNKRLVDDTLANFVKAKKLLQRARSFYNQSRFEQAEKNANKAYEILKQL